MPKRRFHLPSPAFVIATVALFAALGGTSFAATKVIASTHNDKKADTKLIKKLAPKLSVKHAKTANSATTAATATHAASADTATNATNATHATSADSATTATNATHATSADSATNSSQLGGIAASHYIRPGSTLASGDTETGVYGAGDDGTWAIAAITFVPKLAAAPTASSYVTTPTASCPGVGQAAAGHLCIYEGWVNAVTLHCIGSPAAACGGSPTAAGAEIYFAASAGGNTTGNWAYTAP